jgi:hypothetical protein
VGLSTPSSAFIIIAGKTSYLILYIKSRPTHDLALERGCRLSTKRIRVFRTEYIRSLVINKHHKATSIVLRDVTGLKFVLSVSSICAIKVVGIN